MPFRNASSYYSPSLTFLFLIVVSSIAALAISSIETETKQRIRDSLHTVLQITRNTYQTSIDYRKRDITEIATSEVIVGLTQAILTSDLSERSLALEKLHQVIGPKLAREDDLGFDIISRQHINVAASDDTHLGRLNLIQRQRPDYLKRAFSGETLFIPTLQSKMDQPPGQMPRLGVFVAAPIKSHGEVIAVLAVQLNLSSFATRITDLARLGETGETYAFDRNGILITESRFDDQLMQIGLIDPGEKSIFKIRIADPGGNMLIGHRPEAPLAQRPLTLMATHATRGNSGFNVEGYRDYRGVMVFGAWLWDETLGFGITTEVDRNEALIPYYQTRLIIIGVLAVTIMMALGLMARVSRLQSSRKQELQQAYASLEQRVADRTWELNEARRSLEQANRELHLLATTDGLTGLANRRRFDQHFSHEWHRCLRTQDSLGIILLDIDYFKNYNDLYGHPRGDSCLEAIAAVLQQLQASRRPGDLIARYGGEEFVIVLSAADEDYIHDISEQLRISIEKMQLEHRASELATKVVTVSIGYALETNLKKSSAEALLSRADNALYSAKSKGRNRVHGESAASLTVNYGANSASE